MKRFHERHAYRIVVGRSVKAGVPRLTAYRWILPQVSVNKSPALRAVVS